MSSFDRVWSIVFVEGDPKVLFIGRESGLFQKYKATYTEAPLLTLNGHMGAVTGIIATTAEEAWTCSTDRCVRQWLTGAEVEGKREGKCIDTGRALRCFLPVGDGQYAGASSGEIIRLDGGKVSVVLTGHTDAVVSLAASDTHLFSASYDYSIRGWDLATNRAQFLFRGHQNQLKGVIFSGANLFSVCRDESMMVWALPTGAEEGGAGDAAAAGGDAGELNAAGEAGEGGNNNNKPASEADRHSEKGGAAAGERLTTFKPQAVVELPSAPHCCVASGVQLIFGCSDHALRAINTKVLLKSIADYNAKNERAVEVAEKKLQSNANTLSASLRRKAKASIKAVTKQLVADAEAAKLQEAEKRGESPSKQQGGGEGEEGEDGGGAAPPAGGDGEEGELGGAALQLSPAQEAALQAHKDAVNADLERKLKQVEKERLQKVREIAPLKHQTYVQERKNFISSPHCSEFDKAPDAVVVVAMDGLTAYSGVGAEIHTTRCRPGVLTLQ